MGANFQIYGLGPIGVDGDMEATGEVHFYCSLRCAENDKAENLYYGADYSSAVECNEFTTGTICEWCNKELRQPEPESEMEYERRLRG